MIHSIRIHIFFNPILINSIILLHLVISLPISSIFPIPITIPNYPNYIPLTIPNYIISNTPIPPNPSDITYQMCSRYSPVHLPLLFLIVIIVGQKGYGVGR